MKTEPLSDNRPPRIVLFNMTLSGGAGNYIVTLANALAKEGAQTHIVIYKDAVDYPIPEGVRFHRLVPENRGDLKRQLQNLLKSLQPVDLILSNSTPSNKILSALHLPNAMHVVHSAETKTYRGLFAPLKAWWRRRTYRKLYSKKHLVTVSKGLETYIVDTLGARPLSIRTLYNPFDFEMIRRQAEMPDPEIPDEPYIIHVGRLDMRSKRHDILLEAFKRADIPHKLVIVGEGKDREKIEKIIHSLKLEERVIMTGFKANPYSWIRHADLLVLSSDFEGFPRTLVEAAIIGTPIVSTDCPTGPNELLRDELSAYLTPVGNSKALAETIERAFYHYPTFKKAELSRFGQHQIVSHILSFAKDLS
ncbi:glycosyltransferase [Hydrogenimonas sp. SS33]|uniref:glycosyltransferase n=1 Tax=Hydrogenimonas leucolamina TaxID=2954236 RepID=UPI00336BD25F